MCMYRLTCTFIITDFINLFTNLFFIHLCISLVGYKFIYLFLNISIYVVVIDSV